MSVRRSPIALLSGLFLSRSPSSGSLMPKTWPCSAPSSVWRKKSSPSTTVEGSASSAKMLGRFGLKLLQSGDRLTLNEKADAGSSKSLEPSSPTFRAMTFSPGWPCPLKIGSLIGSWKLDVPTYSGRIAQTSDEETHGGFVFVSGLPLVVSMKVQVVVEQVVSVSFTS